MAALALLAHTVRRFVAPRREKRSERERSGATVPDSPVDAGVDLQGAETGAGELTHRRYAIEVPRSTFTCHTLIRAIAQSMRELSPEKLAAFEKTAGSVATMLVGDEYDVTMLGPWNGRVRVAEVTDDSFTLVTLDGHPEAGHIVFSVRELTNRPDAFQVRIESWARARDEIVHVAYDTLAVGRQVQTEVWVTFLQRVAELTGCDEVPEVDINSEELTT